MDITDTLKDINATDRVFSAPSGRFVKVRLQTISPPSGGPPMGLVVLEVSGVGCDEKGKAISHGDSYRFSASSRHTVQADSRVDAKSFMDSIRLSCVEKTETAIQHQIDFGLIQ